VHVRMSFEDSDEVDLLIDDAQLGPLALTEDCVLEVRQAGSEWCRVTLDRLKDLVLEESDFLRVDDLPKSSEMAELKMSDPAAETAVPRRQLLRLGTLTGHDECEARAGGPLPGWDASSKCRHGVRRAQCVSGAGLAVPGRLSS